MSKESLDQFTQLVKKDSALSTKLKATKDPASFERLAVQLGKEKGYNFTTEDLRAQLRDAAKAEGVELSDAQLEAVAGGVATGWNLVAKNCVGSSSLSCYWYALADSGDIY